MCCIGDRNGYVCVAADGTGCVCDIQEMSSIMSMLYDIESTVYVL